MTEIKSHLAEAAVCTDDDGPGIQIGPHNGCIMTIQVYPDDHVVWVAILDKKSLGNGAIDMSAHAEFMRALRQCSEICGSDIRGCYA